MPLTALKPSQIRKIAANSLVGNATGAEARGTSLSVSQVRTLLGLGTTDSPTFNTVTATTSVLSPLFNNPNAAATTLGNSTYGVTVPGPATFSGITTFGNYIQFTGTNTPYIQASGGYLYTGVDGVGRVRIGTDGLVAIGDISMSKTSAQGYIRAYATDGVKNAALYHSGSDAFLVSSSGAVLLNAASGSVGCYGAVNQSFSVYATSGDYIRISQNGTSGGILSTTSGGMNVNTVTGITNIVGTSAAGFLRVYDSAVSKYTQLTHDGTYGTLSTSANNIKLLPASGAVEIWGTDGVSTGKLRVYNSLNTQCITIAGGTAEHVLSTTAGAIVMQPATANTICYLPGTNSTFRVYDSSATKYSELTHDSTNGILSTSSGNLNLVPTGGTVAVTGAVTATGDISMSKTSAQGYIRAYYTDGVKNVAMYHDGTFARLQASTGPVLVYGPTGVMIGGNAGAISTQGGGAYVFTDTGASSFGTLLSGPVRSYDVVGGTKYSQLTHDGTNGILSTSSGNVNLTPAGGTVAVTGGITASGGATITGGGLASTYGVKIGSHSVGVGGIWSDSVTPSATNYNLLVEQTWTLINAPNVAGAIYFMHAGNSTATMTSTLFTCPPINTGAINCQGINVAYGGSGGTISTTTVPLILSSATSIIGLGGVTSSFPAIKRSSTTAAFRLGDDSADAPISCAGITASGNVSFTGGLSTGTVTKVAHYTTTADDYRVNVTANSVDITFETAVGCANREHEVVNSGSGVVTLKTTSAQTISGNASGALTLAQWKSIRVVSDGANWIIMSQIT